MRRNYAALVVVCSSDGAAGVFFGPQAPPPPVAPSLLSWGRLSHILPAIRFAKKSFEQSAQTSADCRPASGVLIGPGLTTFERIRRSFRSVVRVLTKEQIAALLAA